MHLLMQLKLKNKYVSVSFLCFIFKLVVSFDLEKVPFCAHYNIFMPTENRIALCLQAPFDLLLKLFLGRTFHMMDG